MTRLISTDLKTLLEQAGTIHDGYVAGLNCAERVFLTVRKLLDSDVPPQAVAMMSGMGGGMGGMRSGICGAVSGGVATIGLVHGRQNPPDGNRERAAEVARDFICRFQNAFGTTVCGELIGDLLHEATPEATAKQKTRCALYSRKAVQICLETLARFEQSSPRQ